MRFSFRHSGGSEVTPILQTYVRSVSGTVRTHEKREVNDLVSDCPASRLGDLPMTSYRMTGLSLRSECEGTSKCPLLFYPMGSSTSPRVYSTDVRLLRFCYPSGLHVEVGTPTILVECPMTLLVYSLTNSFRMFHHMLIFIFLCVIGSILTVVVR